MKFNSSEYIDATWDQGYRYAVLTDREAKQVIHFYAAEKCAIKAENKQARYYGWNNKYNFIKNKEGKMEIVNMSTETI